MRTRGYVRPPQKPRKLSTVAGLILLGAALAAGSAALTWADATGVDDLRGTLDLTATGGRIAPALVPVALATVAALGALFAAKGLFRRVVGGLILLLGVVVCWLGIRGLLDDPEGSVFGTTSGVALSDVSIRPLGPLMAALGGLALIVAGFAVLTGRTRSRGLSSRYERGSTPAGGSSTTAPTSADPDLAMWKELDAHRDPTLDPPPTGDRDTLDRAPGDSSRRGEPST